MKKIHLLLLATATYFCTNAQVTITNTFDLTAGKLIFLENDTSSSISIGSTTGSGLVWDYTSLKKDEQDTVVLLAPAGHMKADLFPDADFVFLDDGDSSVFYVDNTTNFIKVIGFIELDENGDTNLIDLKMPFITFPSVLGTVAFEDNDFGNFSDTFGIDPDLGGPHPVVDSIKVELTFSLVREMNGEGVLKLPKGDFNVLRQLKYNVQKLTRLMKTNGTWKPMSPTLLTLIGEDSITLDTTEYEVSFWSNDQNAEFSIVSFPLDTNNHTMSDGMIEWHDISPNAIDEKMSLVNSVYPIPAQNSIVVSVININTDIDYQTLSIEGKVIDSGKLTNQLSTISIAKLPKGTYFLKVTSGNSSDVVKFIKN